MEEQVTTTGEGLLAQIENSSSTTTYQHMDAEQFKQLYQQTGTMIPGKSTGIGIKNLTDNSGGWSWASTNPAYAYPPNAEVPPIEVKGKLTIHSFGDQAPWVSPFYVNPYSISVDNPSATRVGYSTSMGTTTTTLSL
jgi:hypothetical protein